jgi:hypothetical protein
LLAEYINNKIVRHDSKIDESSRKNEKISEDKLNDKARISEEMTQTI